MVTATFWLTSVTACSGDGKDAVPADIERAEKAAATGSYRQAVDICNALCRDNDTSAISCVQLCRMATIYALAYEHDTDGDESIASAAACLDRAISMNADSVEMYMAALDASKTGAMQTVLRALDGVYADHTDIPDHEEDGEQPIDGQ